MSNTYKPVERDVEILRWGRTYAEMAPVAQRLGELGFVFKVRSGDEIYRGGSAEPELELYDWRYRATRVYPGEYIVIDGDRRFHVTDKRALNQNYAAA